MVTAAMRDVLSQACPVTAETGLAKENSDMQSVSTIAPVMVAAAIRDLLSQCQPWLLEKLIIENILRWPVLIRERDNLVYRSVYFCLATIAAIMVATAIRDLLSQCQHWLLEKLVLGNILR